MTYSDEMTQGLELQARDGSLSATLTASATMTKRPTYPQDWPRYNRAQCAEEATFLRLLGELVATVDVPERTGRGRPPLPLRDVVFGMIFKVYDGKSARRFTSALRTAQQHGYTGSVIHFNSLNRSFGRDDMTDLLKTLVTRSSLPLRGVERQFSIDSTGLGGKDYLRWVDTKHGTERRKQRW